MFSEMDDLIVLTDSNDSDEFDNIVKKATNNIFSSQDLDISDLSESEFPNVKFDEINEQINETSAKLKRKSLQKDKSKKITINETKSLQKDDLDKFIEACEIKLKNKYQINNDLSIEENNELVVKKGKKIKSKPSDQPNKTDAIDEQAKKKALKRLNSKNRMNSKLEYSLQLMYVFIDEIFSDHDFYCDILNLVKENKINFKIQPQLIPKSITWKRKVENNYVNSQNEVCTDEQIIDENQIIIIWECEETIKHVHNNTLVSEISNIKSLIGDKVITLVMYKVEAYFKYIKDQRKKAENLGAENKKKIKTNHNKKFSHFPKVSRKEFEECLVEIQLLYNVNSRLIETIDEIILLIHHYTKSLATLPSKVEKNIFDTNFFACDNRDNVKVDKDGNGLKRLWQQQLGKINLMSLETSEAITAVYKSPFELMQAYANCTQAEGEMLLKDIKIRRGAGPLTTDKRVGPVLSRKVYTMFTARDGETFLS